MYIATLPINRLPSDVSTFEKTTSVLTVRRGSVVIWQGSLRPLSVPLEGMVDASQVPSNQIIWSPVVANQIKVITGIERRSDGSYAIEWDHSDGLEFPSLEAMTSFASDVVTDPTFAKKLSLAVALSVSPDGTGLSSLVGTKVSISTDARGNEVTVEIPPQ